MNFKDVDRVDNCEFTLPGWSVVLKIKYGLTKQSKSTYLIWQVDGTSHIFKIPLKIVIRALIPILLYERFIPVKTDSKIKKN